MSLNPTKPGSKDPKSRPVINEEKLIDEMHQTVNKLATDPVSRGELKLLNRALKELRYAFKRVRELTGIRRPVRPQRLPKYYTPAEVYALSEGASRVSPKHRLLVDCLIQTGLRIPATLRRRSIQNGLNHVTVVSLLTPHSDAQCHRSTSPLRHNIH